MTNISRARQNLLKLAYFAILASLIIVLQIFSSFFKVGVVNICLVMIPIILGGIYINSFSGALLGAVFGFITFFLGLTGFDIGTNAMIQYNPGATFSICMIKGILAGLLSGLSFTLMVKLTKGKLFPSSLVASVVAPLVNTSIYVLGVAVFFKEFYGFTQTNAFILLGAIFAAIMINFISEIIINIVCGPAVTMALSNIKPLKRSLYSRKGFESKKA